VLDLPAGTAHVWWASRADAAPHLDALLDATERARWTAYRRNEDRERFLVGCALAKSAIAGYTGQRPADVKLDRACARCGKPHGKPAVPGSSLQLSVSHSGGKIAVAVADLTPVGVDVEQADGRAPGGEDPAALARYVMSDAELSGLTPGAADGTHRFLVTWTRKEAVTKATGDGLRVAFRDVVLSPPDASPRVVAWPYPEPPELVSLFDLDASPGYVAALAVLGDCNAVLPADGSSLLAVGA
jgi:4'-phosphopantetheinyl transferase